MRKARESIIIPVGCFFCFVTNNFKQPQHPPNFLRSTDASALILILLTLNRFLPELSNLLSTTQTRQVSAAKNEVACSVFTARLIDQRRIACHSFPILFSRRCSTF